MVDPTTSRFWRGALQSGLLDSAGLRTCWDALPEDKRVAEHVDRRIARQAVQTGALTLWQAQQLMAGRSTGFKIDRYILVELIGQGGMGRVYLARDTRLNRRVAIKILSPERVNNPRAIARFHREAIVGAQLQHDNLVRIYDEGESGGRCYLVMEYIEGKNIGQMMGENGPIPPAVAATLARQVALGLEHAQRKGLIHRDVNPYNILVTRDGQAKLTDLGLAIDLSETDRVTRDGATVGTFDYISPEQARHSHGVDTRSDIYSLGCTLYHMMTCHVPFPSPSLPEKLFGHQTAEPVPIEKLAPGVPVGLAEIVRKTMRKSPDDRYATPLELATALEAYSEDPSESSTIVPAVGTGPPTSKRAASLTQVTSSPPPVEPVPVMAGGPESTAVAESDPVPMPAQPSSADGLFGLGLSVDLGPEPPLSKMKGSAKPNIKPKPAKVAKTPSKGLPVWFAPVAGALILLIAVGSFLVYRSSGGGTPKKPGSRNTKGTKKLANSGKSGSTAASKTFVPDPKGKGVVVVDKDGDMTIERDLVNGMRAAIGGKGYVLLDDGEPLKFSAAEAINVGGGRLVIRAKEGTTPVLQVEVKGQTPFLSTRTDTSIEIVGVTIEVRYIDPGPEPAAVIEAGGSVILNHCAFRLDLSNATANSSAVKLEGGALTATSCWFENFDRALDLSCFDGSTSTLKQCQFVSIGSPPESEGMIGGGWAVRLRSMPGGFAKTGRKFVIDHCTIKGRGLVALEGFSTEAPIKVASIACASLSDALIAWRFNPGDQEMAPTREAMTWTGESDQYEIRGKAWVLVGAKGSPLAPMPDGPVDLESWQLKLANEQVPIPPPIKFTTEASSSSTHPTPPDFGVVGEPGKAPGADPAMVGPGSKGEKP